MRSSQEDIDLLDAYLKGGLGPAETTILKERLAEEMDLNADFQKLKIIREGIRASVLNSKLEMLRRFDDELETKSDNGNDRSSQKEKGSSKGLWFIVILVFTASALVWWFFQKESKANVASEYSTLFAERFDDEFILHRTMRSTLQTDEINATQRRAYELYSIQLFDDAIPLLDELWESQRDTLALFYLGVSYVGTGEEEKGILILKNPALSKYSKQTNFFINH